MYRSSFLQSTPENQVQIVKYLIAYIQSRACNSLQLNAADKVKHIKSMIDVVALRLYLRGRIM